MKWNDVVEYLRKHSSGFRFTQGLKWGNPCCHFYFTSYSKFSTYKKWSTDPGNWNPVLKHSQVQDNQWQNQIEVDAC